MQQNRAGRRLDAVAGAVASRSAALGSVEQSTRFAGSELQAYPRCSPDADSASGGIPQDPPRGCRGEDQLPLWSSSSKPLKPVPAGIRRPMITFSLRPRSQSLFPSIAASVRTRVVSWKEAAEMKLSVLRDALVIPSKTGVNSAGAPPVIDIA